MSGTFNFLTREGVMKRMAKVKMRWVLLAILFFSACDDENHFMEKNVISHNKLSLGGRVQFSDEMSQYLDNENLWNTTIAAALVFDETLDIERKPIILKVINHGKDGEVAFLNGKLMNDQDKQLINDNILKEREDSIKANRELRKNIIDEMADLGVKIDIQKQKEFLDGYDALFMDIDKAMIDELVKHSKLIGIERHSLSEAESIASAMKATYVTQSAGYTYNRNGKDVGIYVGDEGCPASSYLNNYQRLVSSDNDSNHARMVASIVRYVSPNSTIYCRGNFSLPQAGDIGTSSHMPPIFIANLSFGHYSVTYDYQDKAVDDLSYNHGITIVKSAGNNGTYVTSPGHGLNIITVGNYNDHNNTPALFEISPRSSYLRATDTYNVKPELSAPGTDISLPGYKNIEGNALSSCTGTSCAAPHVAGMLANKNSYWSTPNYASFTPSLAKSFALLGATDGVVGGVEKVGYGGIDFYNISHVYAYWWIKGNYNSVEANDALPNNGVIDEYLTLSATHKKARIAFVWMNRGTWIYEHRNDTVSLGAEFRFKVYDPNGNLLSSAWNRANGFMFLEFNVNISGRYHFEIERVANYDQNATLNMAVSIYQ